MSKSNIGVFLFLIISINSAISQSLTIDSCYILAIKNYPLVKQYELLEKTKEFTLSNAGKAYLPQVNITAIGGYIFGGPPAFTEESAFKFIGLGQINQAIWDGGATKSQKEIIRASAEADKASIDVSLHELKSRVNQLYFGILLIDEQLKQLDVQNKILDNNVSRIKQLNENGLVYKTDLDEIKVEQLKLNQQKTEFNFTRSGYLTMLSLLIAVQLNEQTQLEVPVKNSLSPETKIMRPELTFYEQQRNLINANESMQRVGLMPKIGFLGAAVMLAPGISLGPGNEFSDLGVAGLSASWNIGGLYKNSNDKKLNQINRNKINLQEELFRFNTNLQMTQADANLSKQKAVLADDEAIVALRKSIREDYQLKYNNGVSPLLDLLNATEKEHEAVAQKALHEMQILMTIYEHKTISGN